MQQGFEGLVGREFWAGGNFPPFTFSHCLSGKHHDSSHLLFNRFPVHQLIFIRYSCVNVSPFGQASQCCVRDALLEMQKHKDKKAD